MSRFYSKNQIVSLDEDQTHEFKAHSAFVVEDVRPFATSVANGRIRPTYQAISRVVSAFLNTGNGGTVYVGISDDGCAAGMTLTPYQTDHINLSIKNMMSRFTLPVREHQYTVEFVHVLEAGVSPEDVSDSSAAFSVSKQRQEPHAIQTYRKCWCEADAKAMRQSGIVPPTYIVELCILPWDKDHPSNADLRVGNLGLHPVYQNEEGKCFYRKQGSVTSYTLDEITDVSIQEVKAYYEAEIEKLYKPE